MSDKVTDFQQKLLTDAGARKEFAADPAAYLKKHDIELPAGTKLPASIPLDELERAVSTVAPQLSGKGVQAFRTGDSAAVSKLVESAFGPRAAKEDLDHLKTVLDQHRAAAAGSVGIDPGARATVAVVGAVVAAVVAVPVAVFGRTQAPTQILVDKVKDVAVNPSIATQVNKIKPGGG